MEIPYTTWPGTKEIERLKEAKIENHASMSHNEELSVSDTSKTFRYLSMLTVCNF